MYADYSRNIDNGFINLSLPGGQATENHTKNEETAMVLYFTGTGNSRYLARRIAEELEMPLYDLNACIKAGDTAPVQTGRDVVLVTPTYAWRIPRVVSEWMGKTALPTEQRGAGRACASEGADQAQGRAGVSCTERQPLRPLYERPGKPGVLSLFCKSGGLPGNGFLYRLR